jgi:hypothetical protein
MRTSNRYIPRRDVRLLAAQLSTLARIYKDKGVGRLRNLRTAELDRRYQWSKPDDLFNVDTKS